MVSLRKGLISLNINGADVSVPVGWQDISILATWDNGNTQANITTTDMELTLEAAQAVRNYVAEGLAGGVGIFEGLPCKLIGSNESGSRNLFDGYIDLTDGYRDDPRNNRVFVKLRKGDGLNTFNEKLEGLTYGYLESVGVFSDSDYKNVEYVVEKPDNALSIIVTSVTLYMMVKELAEATRSTSEAVTDVAALFAAGVTGSVGATIKAVGQAVILVAYTSILLVAVVTLANNLFAALMSPVRKHKGMTLYKMLENVCQHLGYGFQTDVEDLSKYTFIPSNIEVDKFGNDGFLYIPAGSKKGIPNTSDVGYSCAEMFSLIMRMFYARFAVVEGVVQLRGVESDYWTRGADYSIPDVDAIQTGYNTEDLYANRLTAFSTDPADVYTLENYTGTVCEAITDAITTINSEAKYLRGLERLDIPWALGSRKASLNPLEQALAGLGSAIDSLTGVFGGGTNYAGLIKTRIGMLKTSTNNTTLPKLLYLDGAGKMPANHRDLLSATYLEQNYRYRMSFIADGFRAQKLRFSGVRIPFGFEDFTTLAENSTCFDSEGRASMITKLEYNVDRDSAVIDYDTRKPYTFNLTETLVIP